MSAEARYWLLRTGSTAAIIGSLFAGVGNGVHPITPRDDPEGVARVIAEGDAWTLIHVVILVGILLMLSRFATRSKGGGPRPWPGSAPTQARSVPPSV